ncbi:hypothetical protein [Aliikangiella coralliicola]|uniref:Uncharacterized protein n=1 Tax=Aliikangiella coralliicola TaxID=2592383 RepID=A0A545TWD7_9GAMM|nr:hypothetical protein [Aliikangiella coralliicola]TQV81538.1 hypothetical protein FLL46_25655 [Aliikangiella coralliicola]
MKADLPLPKDKKLTVLHRVEPGCLGPEGMKYIEDFCYLAQQEMVSLDSDFIIWDIVPRYDKSKAEIQYKVNDKNLTYEKASKYLEVFEKNIDDFEEHFNERLMQLIEDFMGRL